MNSIPRSSVYTVGLKKKKKKVKEKKDEWEEVKGPVAGVEPKSILLLFSTGVIRVACGQQRE